MNPQDPATPKTVLRAEATGAAAFDRFLQTLTPQATGHELVRIGAAHDGGYLVPDDLAGESACFSPGTARMAEFEAQLIREYDIPCHMADGSVDTPPLAGPLVRFVQKWLGARPGRKMMTLGRWIKQTGGAATSGDLILQMDIEGDEYRVLTETPRPILRRFRIIVIEFHRMGMCLEKNAFFLIRPIFEKLLSDFAVAHIHPNNAAVPRRNGPLYIPPVMEFTFLRRDRLRAGGPTPHLPHRLDRKNLPARDDVVLPECWRKATGQ